MKSDVWHLMAIIAISGKKFAFIALKDLLEKLRQEFYLASMLFMVNVLMMLLLLGIINIVRSAREGISKGKDYVMRLRFDFCD